MIARQRLTNADLTPAIIAAAAQLRTEGFCASALGAEREIVIDGVRYIAVIEMHNHPVGGPLHPWGDHHGISMFRALDAPKTPPVPENTTPPTLRLGSTGEPVKTLQNALRVTADGSLGPLTQAALKAFQRAHGLDDDGVCGPKTWELVLRMAAPDEVPTNPIPAPPASTVPLPPLPKPAPVPAPAHPPAPPSCFREYRFGKLVVHVRFQRAAPGTFAKGGKGRAIRLLVLHATDGSEVLASAENLQSWLSRPDHPRASWHFVSDIDSITQSVDSDDVAWHAGPVNGYSIGIEQAGKAAQTEEQWADAYSRGMLDQTAKLLAVLAGIHGIPLVFVDRNLKTATGVTTHVAVNKWFGIKGHWDPGPNYPIDLVLSLARKYQSEA
jgi:hypothetical protein